MEWFCFYIVCKKEERKADKILFIVDFCRCLKIIVDEIAETVKVASAIYRLLFILIILV